MNEAWSRSENAAAALVAFFGMMSEEQRQALQDAMRIVQLPQTPEADDDNAATPADENPASRDEPGGR